MRYLLLTEQTSRKEDRCSLDDFVKYKYHALLQAVIKAITFFECTVKAVDLWYSSKHYYINIVNLPDLSFITQPHNDILINDAYCRFCPCRPDVQRKVMFLAWEVKYKSYIYTDTPSGTNGRHSLAYLLPSSYLFLVRQDTQHNTLQPSR